MVQIQEKWKIYSAGSMTAAAIQLGALTRQPPEATPRGRGYPAARRAFRLRFAPRLRAV